MIDSSKTYDPARRLARWIAALLVFALVVGALLGLYISTCKSMATQEEESVRQAILNSAKQCCAIEGTYPSSLSYLEEKYGLSLNHTNFIITYEAFATNVLPEVTVKAK